MGTFATFTINMLRVTFLLFALFSIALAQVSRMTIQESLMAQGKDVCLVCVDDIVKAVEDCQDEDVNILTCITEAVGAASDCAHCICEIWSISSMFLTFVHSFNLFID